MNFFFGIKFLEFSSNLKIPIFQNQGHKKSNYNLYCINIKDNKWNIELYSSQSTDDFYMVNNYDCNNDNIFFLASDNEILNYKEKGFKNLIKLNNFTLTSPAYRANLEINLKEGGFSSYQSEYPLQMINKKSKIYIAGHNGLVGSAILRKLKHDGYSKILTASRFNLDLTNQEKVKPL